MKPTGSSNAKLTDSLRALLLGGALALASSQTSQAAPIPSQSDKSLDVRVEKLRKQLAETEKGSERPVRSG